MHPPTGTAERGFTLIELSIVLVVIGLVVGSVFVGQSLVSAAAVRAQISQIEKFNTAANTFFGKYGYLPGDIPDPAASNFGFKPRAGSFNGTGNGNGIIEGNQQLPQYFYTGMEATGETVMFWVDLSQANLTDTGLTFATPTGWYDGKTATTTPSIANILPQAKIGQGNYVYVYSGGTLNSTWQSDGKNYFGISTVTELWGNWTPYSVPGLTVSQALSIDTKVDDGLPQSGNVTAKYVGTHGESVGPYWAGTTTLATPSTAATAGSTATCFDNGNASGATQQYSVEISNGANVNCALSFKMQAGD